MTARILTQLGIVGIAVYAASLSGCASGVSTYGGETTFKCAAKFEEGVPCDSISGTVSNFDAGNLGWQKKDAPKLSPTDVADKMKELQTLPPVMGAPNQGNHSVPATAKISPRQMPTPTVGMPLRVPERILRIWVAPYEDDDGALNDQKYVYLTVQKGGWALEANRLNVQGSSYKQIKPLGNAKQSDTNSAGEPRSEARAQAQSTIVNNPNLSNAPKKRQPVANDAEGE